MMMMIVLVLQTYLQSFLHSDLYIKYLSDLINTVHLAHDTVVFPRQHTGSTYLLFASIFAYQMDCLADLTQILMVSCSGNSTHVQKAVAVWFAIV